MVQGQRLSALGIERKSQVDSRRRQIAIGIQNEPLPWLKQGRRGKDEAERISRVALEEGAVVGWIGGLKLSYPGGVWELHPLVVRAERQRQGLGR
ncbi:MAG: GNAT family N-acetyltransferase, partial [Planctomycetes bacterium]|nr:GNAT family N-acetyltransferase [Planctomycetota bacterium]